MSHRHFIADDPPTYVKRHILERRMGTWSDDERIHSLAAKKLISTNTDRIEIDNSVKGVTLSVATPKSRSIETSSMNHKWFLPFAFFTSLTSTAFADHPLTINAAGTYGNDAWSSENPSVAAVTIASSVPAGSTVTIENATITSKGDLIDCQAQGINLIVHDVGARGQNPAVAGQRKGDFVHIISPASLYIFNCDIKSVSHALECFGNLGSATSATIAFHHNIVRNIDGRLSDGSNGYQTTSWATAGASCITLTYVQSDPNISITWNDVRNYQGQALAGDLFDLYDTSGTANSPIQIANNFVKGQFPNNDTETGGRGVFVMDGDPNSTLPTQYVDIHDNQCVGCEGYSIYLYWGANFNVYNNRVVTSMIDSTTGSYYESAGGGIGMQDATPAGSGWTSTWQVYDNVVGAMGPDGKVREDFLFSPSSLSRKATKNSSLTQDRNAKITLSDEDNEEQIWTSKREYPNGPQIIGPRSD